MDVLKQMQDVRHFLTLAQAPDVSDPDRAAYLATARYHLSRAMTSYVAFGISIAQEVTDQKAAAKESGNV